jgi:HEAT repeat protein
VPPLAELLNSGDATARLNAMMTLGLMGPDARGALPTIVEALSDPSHEVRAEAARALRRLGPHDARVTILLASALDNDLDFSVRMNAALALSGSADATAERSLVLALTRDSEALVREAAASALASLPTLSSTSLAALRQYRLRKERQASTNR